jgi:hypothetical protein
VQRDELGTIKSRRQQRSKQTLRRPGSSPRTADLLSAMSARLVRAKALNRYAIASGPRSPAASIIPRGEMVGSGGRALS